MSEDKKLERFKLRRCGNCRVATKYIQEAKQILQGDSIDDTQHWHLLTVQNTLQDKLKLMSDIHNNI